MRGHRGAQVWWIVSTGRRAVPRRVRQLAAAQDGAGGGQGPNPIASPRAQAAAGAGDRTAVAVHLPLPVIRRRRDAAARAARNSLIEFHVTSLDVTHSFWAYQLGVKADANPGVDNVVYVTPTSRDFGIHCSELCGLLHGYMFDTGEVVTPAAFGRGSRGSAHRAGDAELPPYATSYSPEPVRRGG